VAYATADDMGDAMGDKDGGEVTFMQVLRAEGLSFHDIRSLESIKRPVTALSKMG
jgi:hypothetical protein